MKQVQLIVDRRGSQQKRGGGSADSSEGTETSLEATVLFVVEPDDSERKRLAMTFLAPLELLERFKFETEVLLQWTLGEEDSELPPSEKNLPA